MKTTVFGILFALIAVAAFAAADYSVKKQGVTITYTDGKSDRVKLDFIDNENVIIIVEGSDRKLETIKKPRSRVDSLSFDGKDYGKQFGQGEEGFVMTDGRVLKGIVEGLDATSFWRRLSQGGKTERLDRDSVAFIQFRKAEEIGSNVPPKPQKATMAVSAKQGWGLTNMIVKKGQRVYFTVDAKQPIMCGGVPNVNADGVDPFTMDPTRPIKDAKACALIAKIGEYIFRVGTMETPFVAQQDGELLLGINDTRFVNNAGAFYVMIVIQ